MILHGFLKYIEMKILKFYKEDKKWYLDFPEYIIAGGTKAELQMVFGADDLLDRFCRIGESELTLEINIENKATVNTYEILIKSQTKIDSGCFYVRPIWSPVSFDCNTEPDYKISDYQVVWLCDVTKFVFDGEFPSRIYFKTI